MSRFSVPASIVPVVLVVGLASLASVAPLVADVDRPALQAEIRSLLDAGDWHEAEKKIHRAEKKILHKDEVRFSDREDLAALALYRAVAALNLGRADEAEWFWYLAYGLDLATSRRDVSDWGEAQEFFSTIEVRAVGKLPEDAVDPFTRFYSKDFEQPEPPELYAPRSLQQSHRVWDSEPVRIELYLEADGRPRQPRLLGRPAHAMLVYTLFEEYWERDWEPARFEGEPVAALFESTRKSGSQNRWDN